jgi:hypothetical protein
MSAAIAEPLSRIPPPRAVDAEFLGRAREFRRRFEPGDRAINGVVDCLMQPLIDRSRRHPVPRKGSRAGVRAAGGPRLCRGFYGSRVV